MTAEQPSLPPSSPGADNTVPESPSPESSSTYTDAKSTKKRPAVTTSNDPQESEHRVNPAAANANRSDGTPPPRAAASASSQSRTSRSIKSEIVVRQSEETLQTLQRNIHYASHELLQSLGTYLAQLNATAQQQQSPSSRRHKASGGISLPASAVGWLASELETMNQSAVSSSLFSSATSTKARMLSKVRDLLPLLTHLRITADPWPTAAAAGSASNKSSLSAASNSSSMAYSFSMPLSLQQQHQSLQQLHRLRYSPRVNVGIFPNCQVLLLDQVPPEWVVGLPDLMDSLQVLRVERACLYDLKQFLLGRGDEEGRAVYYSKLTHLKLSHCSLGEMTRGFAPSLEGGRRGRGNNNTQALPLARMPKLVSLSLSHNDIRSEGTALGCGISKCSELSIVDLSYNQLTSLSNAPLYLGNIQILLLTGNQIESARGLDRLYALKTLTLDDNNIQEWVDLAGLARLPELKTLKLKGNPLMESSKDRKNSRVMLLDLFREQRRGSLGRNATFRQMSQVLPVLDGKPASERELKALQQRAFPTVAATIVPSNDSNSSTGDDNNNNSSNISRQRMTGGPKADDEAVAAPRITGRKRGKRRKGKKATILEGGNAGASGIVNGISAEGRLVLAKEDQAVASLVQSSDEEKEEIAISEGGSGMTNMKGKNSQKSTQMAPPPKIAFSIEEVLSSLTPSYEMTTAEPQHKNDQKLDDETAPGDCSHSNDSGLGGVRQQEKAEIAGDPVADFEWPQPVAYVPEQNLYEEFDLRPQPKKAPKRQKRRKDKTPGSNKLRQKPSPKIENGGWERDTRPAATLAPTNDPGFNHDRTTPAKRPSSATAKDSSPASYASSSHESRNASIKSDTVTQNAQIPENGSVVSSASQRTGNRPANFDLGSVSSDGGEVANQGSRRESVAGAFFPAMAMASGSGGGDDTTCSSIGTNRSSVASGARTGKSSDSKLDNFHLAEIKSKFLGLEHQRQLKVADNLELYFRAFVFPELLPDINTSQDDNEDDNWRSVFFRYPRIQLLPNDRKLREANRSKGASLGMQRRQTVGEQYREQLVRVWREDVVACGKPALRRLPPNRSAHYGFHGELTWVDGKVKTVSDCRRVILCLSNTSFYVILENDTVTSKEKTAAQASQAVSPDSKDSKRSTRKRSRMYPSPMEEDATFEQALWPHAVACHPLEDLISITMGFGFQRMSLRFRNTAYPSAVDFTYLLLTSNKMQTVSLVQDVQGLCKEIKMENGQTDLTEDPIKIDNDDKYFLDALATAVAPDPLGAVLHYQIVKQRWKHGQRGAVSRACVVTDSRIFLLDEDYTGDGSKSIDADSGRRLGSPSYSLVDGGELKQVAEVRAADADPNAITIVIMPLSSLQRTHRWRLLCRDRTGAEKLVEDVRKGISLVE